MASAQSLLGLVNQLQNMESCFTSILMEGAMKMCALSDAKIFILVETSDGRRFCGQRHLCDAYMAGSLSPLVNDVEMDVDTSISAVREKPVPPLHVHVSSVPATLPPQPTQEPLSPVTPSAKKRKRPSAGRQNSPKKTKENLWDHPVCDLNNLKTENEDIIAPEADLEKKRFNGFDVNDVDHDENTVVVIENSSQDEQSLDLISSNMTLANLPDIPPDKLMALQWITPEDALTKGSVGFKLLNSTLYDLGKRIAHICCRKGFIDSKDPRSKAEFSSYFDSWINENLQHLVEHGHKIFDGNQNRSALGFMKYITRTNFNSTMKSFVTVKKPN